MVMAMIAVGIGVYSLQSPLMEKTQTAIFVSSKSSDLSARQAILRFLVADNVALNYRKGQNAPYQAWLNESKHLQLIAELETIEAVTISNAEINIYDLERLVNMPNLQHLCIYGYPHYYEPSPGKEDELLSVIARMGKLKSLQLGDASQLFSREAIVTTLENLHLEKFLLFRTSRSYVEFFEDRFPEIYDHYLEIPFDMPGRIPRK
jgi:hypothetical protein